MIQVPYSWYKVHILTRSYEKKSSDSGDYVTIPHGFSQFWQYLSCNFEKKLFLSGVIVLVNRRRKDMKVKFMTFSFHSGRFTVICKEYLKQAIFIFWHFHIRFVESYFCFKDYKVFPGSHRLSASHQL